MAKRNAEKELTDRNWDQEEEVEEVGTFSVASEEVLKNRAIKKAKRRNVGFESESGGAFKGFKGLVASGGGGFGGFGNGTGGKPLEGLSNGGSGIGGSSALSGPPSFANLKAAPEAKASSFGSGPANGPGPTTSPVEKKASGSKTNSDGQGAAATAGGSGGSGSGRACGASAYHKQLAALNCSVRDWIVKHVNTNPLCDLTPVFKDYAKYLAGIEQQPGGSSDSGSESEGSRKPSGPPPPPGSARPQQGSAFLFHGSKTDGPADTGAEKKEEPVAGSFHFGKKVDSSALGALGSGPLPSFSFSPGGSGLFGKDAGQGKPASTPFSASSQEGRPEGAGSDRAGGDEEESEEPPTVIVNEVREEDAFYSKKCKLFYKKDNEYKEKGVGTLHLKPAGKQKTQLLVRADTNLGNILLNVLIPPKMPCTRTGKNNVLIVCVPNPPIDEKNATVPVPMLIRVKTSKDADELHKILLEKKEA
ncbi:nuclear pore complex protein Nup50 [Ornithorhynchus anatinus]|nr:nuclear pore complex protein Nup50 [Ornithorhynchus anatinus]XP_028935155.1 nuclear pore complex protein Nup50 [Ornithorhynchus anatinus]